MEKYLEILKQVKLFEGIKGDELAAILKCLNAKTAEYSKRDIIFLSGDPVKSIGIVISGNVEIIKEDITGRQTLIAFLSEEDTFGEVMACANVQKNPYTVMAATEAKIIFIDYKKVVHSCTNACEFHSLLVQNMLKLIAQKSLDLSYKINYLLLKGMRQKIASYLTEQYLQQNNTIFNIALSRGQLADFLNVDRSAMSRELCRMRDEGIIEFWKNGFKIIDLDKLKAYV